MSESSKIEEVRKMVLHEVTEFFRPDHLEDTVMPLLLRLHLTTENFLERIITAELPGGHTLIKNTRLTYAEKLEVVNSFGNVAENTIGALRKLNTVRNGASHQKNFVITKEHVDKIGMPLGKKYIDIKKKHASDLEVMATETFSSVFGYLLYAVYNSEGVIKGT